MISTAWFVSLQHQCSVQSGLCHYSTCIQYTQVCVSAASVIDILRFVSLQHHCSVQSGLCHSSTCSAQSGLYHCSTGVHYSPVYFGAVLVFSAVSPQQDDLWLSGPPPGQRAERAGGGDRTPDRRKPADLRADSIATMPLVPRKQENIE
ncbi:hypothetical protein PoB_003467400 [Plakobranchus ocellatus]|uniref:Uncharacterized protein n=1 Tax=Plakobranchus ocellatus TaxID=259542 RepID=A0AAV4APD1_9GAST|nr:hypothetical protein PoB_003467400 [Plakobranchus ocellatus]